MKKVFLEPGEVFHCPHCRVKTVWGVKKTIYFSNTIHQLSGICRLNTYTSRDKIKIEDAKSLCASCGKNVYEELVSKIQYYIPDELFEI